MNTYTIEVRIQADTDPKEWLVDAIYEQLDRPAKEDLLSVVTTNIEELT